MTTNASFEYLELHGDEVDAHRDALGRLRIAVFREFPYLYDGDLDYEREYLRVYTESANSLVVLLQADGQLVGATTCIPMCDESPEFQQPFQDAEIPTDGILYFGESIILPEFRGAGAGHAFFTRREQHARKIGATLMAFCSVDRPVDHPLRPQDYRPLDAFWKRMGFSRDESLRCSLPWKDIDAAEPSTKTLTFWTKSAPWSA